MPQLSRNPWTDDDLAALYRAYLVRGGPVVLPPGLVGRHSPGSCRQEAAKRGFTNPARPRTVIEPYELTVAEAAYIAGIIDGEGHVKPEGSYLTVSSTTREITDWLLEHIPGSRLAKPQQPKVERYKLIHRWILSGHIGCQILAPQILPFVLIPEKRRRLTLLAAGRATAPPNPRLELPGQARGVPGLKRADVCKNGHDRAELAVGEECPICKADYARAYREANQEKHREYMREYHRKRRATMERDG